MEPTTTAAVSLKLPTFWAEQPDVWFAQTEAQFALRNITADNTKYYYVISSLDSKTAERVVDLLRDPPSENMYDAIKSRLTNTFSLSRQQRAKQLLAMASGTLGDRKPSQVMDHRLNLLHGDGMNLLAEQIFLDLMPNDIRPQLHDADFTAPRQVALKADQLLLNRERSYEPSGISQVLPSSKTTKDVSKLCYYHARFGNSAKKCRQPCSFTGNIPADQE